MAAVRTAAVEWGVRHAASPDQASHIDVRDDETAARRWVETLNFCGNHDAVLVTRAPGGDWQTVSEATS